MTRLAGARGGDGLDLVSNLEAAGASSRYQMSVGPGSTIGPFRLGSLLGRGGMGEVFAATDTRLDRQVAIKILPPDFAANPERLRRFEREAKALAALSHPNILAVYEVGAGKGVSYFVSELLEGQSLRQVLTSGRLPPRKAVEYALQVAQGLAAAHARGIVHRDLKPENIFISKDGRVKILDLGLAKLQAGTPGAGESGSSSAPGTDRSDVATLIQSTAAGLAMGTPGYMAPEQIRGEAIDQRVDLFALGCTLHEMLSGQRAFRRDTAAETMTAILKEEPADLTELVPNLAPPLNQIIRRCLEKTPERRFQSASDLAFALEALSGSGSGWSVAGNRPKSSRGWVGKAFAAAAWGAILCALFLAGRWSYRPAPAPAASWRGDRLDGPSIALAPRLSPDGKEVAFAAIVDGQSQLALMAVNSGDWQVLTTNRDRGLVDDICWSPDGLQLYFGRVADGPNGVYRISKYGRGERLILARADSAKALPDGSLLLLRRNAAGRAQLYNYFPDTELLQPLNGLPTTSPIPFTALVPNRRAAVFRGTTTNQPAANPTLWLLDLNSGQSRPFLTNICARLGLGPKSFAFNFSQDGKRFCFDSAADSLHRICAVDLDRPDTVVPLLSLTAPPSTLEMDAAGDLYLDVPERPTEIVRARSRDSFERLPIAQTFEECRALPLPDSRILFDTKIRGASRLMILQPGQEPRPFLESSKLECSAPFAQLGANRVLFTVLEGGLRGLASATLDGRDLKRLAPFRWDGWSLAASPEGTTIYYADRGSIYAVPVEGGAPKRVCVGDRVAVDPAGAYLVTEVNGPGGNQLLRFTFANAREERLPVSVKYPLASSGLGPNAVARDGRIAVQVAPLDSWFWSAAILDPKTGGTELATPYQADMVSPGWDAEGRFVSAAMFFRSTLWRFRPDAPAVSATTPNPE